MEVNVHGWRGNHKGHEEHEEHEGRKGRGGGGTTKGRKNTKDTKEEREEEAREEAKEEEAREEEAREEEGEGARKAFGWDGLPGTVGSAYDPPDAVFEKLGVEVDQKAQTKVGAPRWPPR
ncbi:MAG: hypothetical protein WCK05_02250 [Planctomycetota bacterium]